MVRYEYEFWPLLLVFDTAVNGVAARCSRQRQFLQQHEKLVDACIASLLSPEYMLIDGNNKRSLRMHRAYYPSEERRN